MCAGGGSGGHVTPVLAVLHELKRHDPDLKSYFITDRKFGPQAHEIMAKAPFEVELKRIYAGKLRRYHRVALWRQLIDVRTMAKNFGDLFLVGLGIMQSIKFIIKVKPDAVFTKGGFVCLPVGLAARLLGIPLVIHDSDSHPGLTNRILAKHAKVIGTGAPVEHYPYPKGRTHYVGIPVDRAFRPADSKKQQQLKAELGLHDTTKPLLVVTGGGQGARNLNRAVVNVASQLVNKLAILHVTGQGNYNEVLKAAPEHVDYIVKPFVPGLATAFRAADMVITRAGATTMVELAAAAKPVIIVPHPNLAGGHQLKNAAVFKQAGAAVVLDEDELILHPLRLKKAVVELLEKPAVRAKLGKALHRFAKPYAALDMAALIVEAACVNKKQRG